MDKPDTLGRGAIEPLARFEVVAIPPGHKGFLVRNDAVVLDENDAIRWRPRVGLAARVLQVEGELHRDVALG
jgi:hypothetical protein